MNLNTLQTRIVKMNEVREIHLACLHILENFALDITHRKNLFKLVIRTLFKVCGRGSANLIVRDTILHGNLFILKAMNEYYRIHGFHFCGLTSVAIEHNHFEILKYLYKNNYYNCSHCDWNMATQLERTNMSFFLERYVHSEMKRDCTIHDIIERDDAMDFLEQWNITMINDCPLNDITII